MNKDALLFCLVLGLCSALDPISKNDQLDFLERNLKLGYWLLHENGQKLKTRSAGKSEAYAISLYKRALKNNRVRFGSDRRRVVCFPNNHCVNLGDLGVHP
ncbi:hypothetical protein FQR65_LT01279 [Abscondita terminalis]|nr:hypothetical protein FQR65_LT01279 [Abscondita terminalis]